jgi:hypothetical protein
MKTENEMLQTVLDEKEEEIEKLEEEKEEEIDLMEGTRYKPELVELVWKLQDNNVAFHSIPSVIAACLKLVGKRAVQLPNVKTITNMNLSRLAASQKQTEVMIQ